MIETWIKTAGLATPVAAMPGTGYLSLAIGKEPAGNLVIIQVGDLGYMDSPVHETPNLDRLAASGTQVTNAYAASSSCTPSRACMLTGFRPNRHGVYTVVRNRGEQGDWNLIPEHNPKDSW
jgi:arylsulfatase A-like enzyme